MNRRSFITGCIAASTAPAFVKADSLMGLWIPKDAFVLTVDMQEDIMRSMLMAASEHIIDCYNSAFLERFGLELVKSPSEIAYDVASDYEIDTTGLSDIIVA